MIIQGRGISRGIGTGQLLVGPDPISFLSGVDPETGIIMEKGHPLEGKDISGSVLVFEYGMAVIFVYQIIARMRQRILRL